MQGARPSQVSSLQVRPLRLDSLSFPARVTALPSLGHPVSACKALLSLTNASSSFQMQQALALPGSCMPCSACLQDTWIQNGETLCLHVSLQRTVSHGQELALLVSSTQGLPPGPLQQGAPLCIGMQRQPGSTLLSFTNLMWLQVQSSASQAEDKLPTPPPKKKKLDEHLET